jgi:hypothetical protein
LEGSWDKRWWCYPDIEAAFGREDARFDHGFMWDGENLGVIAVPDARGTEVDGVGDAGQIFGSYWGPRGLRYAYVKTGEAYTTIAYPGASQTYICHIDDSGRIFGVYTGDDWKFSRGHEAHHVFVKEGDTWTPVELPGERIARVVFYNRYYDDCRWPVSRRNDAHHCPVRNHNRWMTCGSDYRNGSIELFRSGESGWVCGEYHNPWTDDDLGFIYDGRSWALVDYPGAANTRFCGIDTDGRPYGTYDVVEEVGGKCNHGFVKDGEGWITVDFPGAANTELCGIDAGGRLYGTYDIAADGSRTNRHGFVKDGDTWISIDYPGAAETTIRGVNAAGRFYGHYCDDAARENCHVYVAR